MKRFTLLAVAMLPIAAVAGQRMPATFEANRVFVAPVAANGKSLKLYTDTGGGLFVTESAAKRLHFKSETAPPGPDDKPPRPFPFTRLTAWKSTAAIPPPLGNQGRVGILPDTQAPDGLGDGLLGEAWLGGRTWTWDYPERTLTLEDAGWHAPNDAARVALAFKNAADGRRDNNFARVAMKVDGESIAMLLDTGATGHPSAAGKMADTSETVDGYRATSFITRSVFERWHRAHPDWRVIDRGDDLLASKHIDARTIEIAAVELAGHRIGPVWFTERPDKNFHEYMSSMMDARVEGAIGGNALAHFVMTIDYPNAVAYFRCVKDCDARPRPAP